MAGCDGQDVVIKLQQGERPAMAIPDFRGTGDAQNYMGAFNQTLWADVEGAGFSRWSPRPCTVCDSAAALGFPRAAGPRGLPGRATARARPPADHPTTNRRRLMDVGLVRAPASANYLAFGYTAVQNGVFVLRGWLFDLSRGTPANAQVVGNTYLGTVDEAGARKVAHDFAADIIARFGGKTLFGTHVYFVSNRTGHKEVWVMDPDGKNQRQITRFNSTSIQPTVSRTAPR